MRNWNSLLPCNLKSSPSTVCIVPMRNWNMLGSGVGFRTMPKEFVSYLWGIETRKKSIINFCACSGLYRTYEELKPRRWRQNAICWPRVCIVPMRNWNFRFFCFWLGLRFSFVSYLWGIETCPSIAVANSSAGLYRTYEELKLLSWTVLHLNVILWKEGWRWLRIL